MGKQSEVEVIIKISRGYLHFIGVDGRVMALKTRLENNSPKAIKDSVIFAIKNIAIFIESDNNAIELSPCLRNSKYDKNETLPLAYRSFIESVDKITEMQCGEVCLIGDLEKTILWDISNVKGRLHILPTTGQISCSAILANEDGTLIGFHTAADGYIKLPQ